MRKVQYNARERNGKERKWQIKWGENPTNYKGPNPNNQQRRITLNPSISYFMYSQFTIWIACYNLWLRTTHNNAMSQVPNSKCSCLCLYFGKKYERVYFIFYVIGNISFTYSCPPFHFFPSSRSTIHIRDTNPASNFSRNYRKKWRSEEWVRLSTFPVQSSQFKEGNVILYS